MSTDTRDPLVIQQDDIYGRVLSDAFLANVAVLYERLGITTNEIDRVTAELNPRGGKLGVVIIVLMPELLPEGASTPGALYKISHAVQVIENPSINQGSTAVGLSCEQVAQRIRQILQNFSAGWGPALNLASMKPANYREGTRSYVIEVSLESGDRAIPKVATPVIAAAGNVITLTCSTGSAVIYYTTDGTYPGSGNAAATVYSAPFTAPAFAIVRTAAQLVNFQPSNIARLELST